jgi:hypothetical protein
MTIINISEFLTIKFVPVDDWYQEYGPKVLAGKPGAKSEFSEKIILMLSQDYIPQQSSPKT